MINRALMHLLWGLALAPLLIGVINRVKACFAGRSGQPLLQLYFDLFKLLRKGAVYSTTTSFVFRLAPVVGLAAVLAALTVVPFAARQALLSFPGDLVLLAYLLGLMRFFTVLGALDTGSAFEGMGASREVTFSALAEIALFLGLAAVARGTGQWSLYGMFGSIDLNFWKEFGPQLVLVLAALLVVFLTENARIPVDDPNTHLELTMIHEVMVLDHGGPDFAFIQYGAALKMWVLGSLMLGLLPLRSLPPLAAELLALVLMFALAALVGVIESIMARLRLVHVPQLLVGASALSAVALIMMLR